jgi:hypothetical protein
MSPSEHLDALITSAYLNEPDDRVYRALMAQRDVEINTLECSIAIAIPQPIFPSPPKPKYYSFKGIGRMETRYNELTGDPYEVEVVIIVEDENGVLCIEE